MPTKKKPKKLNKFLRALIPNTKLKQFLAFVFVFAVAGGGYLVFKTFAATYPPATFTTNYGINPGVAEIYCTNTAAPGLGGVAFNCLRKNTPAGYYNVGNYSVANRKFTSLTASYKATYGSSSIRDYGQAGVRKCNNMDNYFGGQGPLDTDFGPVYFGYIYRYVWDFTAYGYIWQAATATYSSITGGCSTNNNWFNRDDLMMQVYQRNL